MPYYVCPTHKLAWPSYSSLVFHYLSSAHRGDEEPRPSKEEAEHEELPEGVTVSTPRARRRRGAGGADSGGGAPVDVEYIVEELPTDPPELFYSLLRLKGINDQAAQRLRREFKLSPWMWGDAQEIASLLKGAKLGIGQDWVRSFLKQYGNTAEIPSDEGGIGFVGTRRGLRDDFFGKMEAAGPQDPFTAFLKYQAYRESREDERQRGVDPATEQRLGGIEESHRQLMDTQSKLLEMLEKQDRDRERAELEGKFARLEERLASKQQSEGGESWLSQFLAEREKRYEGLIKDLGDKLAQATVDVAEARRETRTARAEVIAEEEERLDKAKKRLEESGYAPRQRSTEERILDVVQEQIAPAVVTEVKEGRRLIERAVGARPAESLNQPVSSEEASRIAELMDLEQRIKDIR